jgi:hypothetical protein
MDPEPSAGDSAQDDRHQKVLHEQGFKGFE